MSLSVDTLALLNWRSLDDLEMELDPRMTILVGPNASGKTNTLEALQILTSGRSFRHSKPSELVRDGCEQGRATLTATGDGRIIDVTCDVTPQRRELLLNGKRVYPRDLSGFLVSILFTPDDLSLVKGSATCRRESLDDFGRQINKGYDKVLSAYARAIEQRNRLLKDGCPDKELFEAWDGSVSYGAASLLHHRLSLFDRMRTYLAPLYHHLGGGEEVSCTYESTLGEDVADLDREGLRERMQTLLLERRDEELRRGHTLIGPHRDDISFTIDGRDARTFASQGQQRTLAIAWKMAEVQVCEEVLLSPPLLLLDDVMSELDKTRRECLCEIVLGGVQTIMTTTNLGYFSEDVLSAAKVVGFGHE